MAIPTTETFDAASVDPDTVLLTGAMPAHSALEDMDNDNDFDLLLLFYTWELDLTSESTQVILKAETSDCKIVTGTDSIKIVP